MKKKIEAVEKLKEGTQDGSNESKFINDLMSTVENNVDTNNILKNRMLNELFHESVPVILKEDDLNSMYYSIENRSPFLSKKLVQYSLNINNSFYIKNGYSKFILRQALKGILNNKVRLDRKKIGFNSNYNEVSILYKNKKIEKINKANKSLIAEKISKRIINNFI